jgi:cellulose synthase operon protein C
VKRFSTLLRTTLAGLVLAAGAPALAQPGAPAAEPAAEPTVPRRDTPLVLQLSPEELRELKQHEQDFARYKAAAERHEGRMRAVLLGEYEDRIARLDKRYGEGLRKAEAEQRQRHIDAIARLQKFVADYPDHPQFTPDAMFRLADLYLDEANFEFEKQLERFGSAPVEGADLDAELQATADYSKSLALWQDIVQRFPDYRQRPGTLYLYGYYLKQTGEDRKSLQVFRGLVCGNKHEPLGEPPPAPNRDQVRLSTVAAKRTFVNPYADCQAITDDKALIEDAWVRGVGDIHFLTPGELNESIAAYEKVARNKQSKFYDEALYKLAWSYYRNDDFLKGIEAFDESVVFSDSLVAQGKDPLPLRPEALQYIAISFTDPWSVDEQPDPVRGFDRAFGFYKDRMTEPHVRDVFEQLGDTFMVLEAYDQAVDSYRIALDKWPLDPRNPEVHQKIVNAFESKGDTDAADDEAAKLVARYAAGTDWYRANEMNREAIESQARINERMLRAAAENLHKAAQAARQEYVARPTPAGKERYVDLYRRSAALYRQFIEEYPTSEQVYEFTYRIGETLFFAEEYLTSIDYYRWVRDHRDLSEQRFEKAARSIVQAYQKEVEKQVASNQIVEPPVPTLEQLKALPSPIRPQTIPPIQRELQKALDEYQTLINDPSTAPNMGLLAALVSYRYLHLDDAVPRFEKVFDRFCGTPEATKAKDGLLAIYEARNEDAKFKSTNDKFITKQCGSAEDISLALAQNRSKEFREAEDLFKAQRFDAAAIAFYRYYKQADARDPNRPVALFNSAVAYDKSGKPKTAVYLFKEFTDNPAPDFRGSEYYLPALYATAASYYKAFDYKNAVTTYLDVVRISNEKGRKPPAGERSLEQIRLDALFNAATLRELDRVFKDPKGAPGTGAASLYKRYAELEPDRRKADRAMWSIPRLWVEAQELELAARAYADWRSKYGRDPANGDDYIYSFWNMAKQYEKKGRKKETADTKAATIQAWSTVGRPQGTAGADLAAEFDFELAEAAYNRDFAPYKPGKARTEKEAKKTLDSLDSISQRTRDRFLALAKYSSGPWGLASLVRIGDTFFFQAIKITEIPIPKEIEDLDRRAPDKDILIKYQAAIDTLVKPLEQQARVQWEKVVTTGKQQGVSNKWTQLAQERLHDFISQDEFPVLRESLAEGTQNP